MPTKQVREKVEEPKKGPLQCWGCGEAHLLRDFPHKQHDNKRVYHVQEATTINDVAKEHAKNLCSYLESTRRPPSFCGGAGRYNFQTTHFYFD
jgi:hypothetical protein